MDWKLLIASMIVAGTFLFLAVEVFESKFIGLTWFFVTIIGLGLLKAAK